jgi:hypothetical protein
MVHGQLNHSSDLNEIMEEVEVWGPFHIYETDDDEAMLRILAQGEDPISLGGDIHWMLSEVV